VLRRDVIALIGGAAVAWPLAARAQQKPMPVIGYLSTGSPGSTFVTFVAAFREGLSETGYIEGQNLAIQYRWAEGRYDRLPALAADLVGRKVDVIYAASGPSALLAKRATAAIPIVFLTGGDPIADELVASLARAGGNLTGASLLASELMPKQFELLLNLVPEARVIALLVNPNNSFTERLIRDERRAANAKGVQLHILNAATEGEIDVAFATIAQLRADALVVATDALFTGWREQLVAQAARRAIPTIYYLREFAASGGLISYGASLTAAVRRLGIYAGRILKGEKPVDLPVQQPTTFELVINLETAKTLGLTIPPSLLARADEVIE
jgi:putative tryptophan/tyrosine transport system substrate-binding protein